MSKGRALLFASVVCLSLACQKHGDADEGRAESAADAGKDEGGSVDGPSEPAKDDRIPALTGAPVGVQAGWVEGAMVYASVRTSAVQDLLQSVPMGPREAKDFAKIGAVLGADPRVDDVLAHLGIAKDGHLSLSVRPVVTFAAEIRKAIADKSPGIAELAPYVHRGERSKVDVIEAPPHDPDDPEQDPSLVPLELSPETQALVRKAKSLGVHIRVHLPLSTPGKIDGLVALLAEDLQNERWATTCAAVGPARACGGHSDGVAVVRDAAGGLQVDLLLLFEGDYDQPDDEYRRAAIQQALAAPTASASTPAAGLRGDAVLHVDGPGVVTAMRAAALADVIDRLHDEPETESWRERRFAKKEDGLRALHETDRMFEGVTVEAMLSRDEALAVANWIPTPYGRAHMDAVFAQETIDADVPSIAALCDGALVCGRSRGLPRRKNFAALATGVYADPAALGELMERNEEEAAAVLMLETWPNAIGATAGLPGSLLEGPEAYMVQNVIDMSERVLGAGFSIRSLAETRHTLTGDWVGYLRTSAGDLSALKGFMQLAEVRMSPASIPEVPGRVEFAPIPDGDVAGNVYAIYDPSASTGEWGWAVLADSDDRVRWLAGLAHDDGAVPIIYGEIGDLWRLVASFREGREDLGFAQAWLSRRWVRGQLGVGEGGAPQLRWAMGKL